MCECVREREREREKMYFYYGCKSHIIMLIVNIGNDKVSYVTQLIFRVFL